MARIALAIATLILGSTTIVSSANACISCSYAPEVVHTPAPGAKPASKKSVQVASKKPVKAASKKPAKVAVTQSRKPAAAKKRPSKPAPRIETASLRKPKASSSSSVAATAAAPTNDVKVAAATVGANNCTRYVPSIGKTMSTPCE